MEVFLIISLLVGSSFGLLYNGTCPNNFNCYNPKLKLAVNDLLGVWYFQAVIPFPFEMDKKCTYVVQYPTFNPNEFISIRHDINKITSEKTESVGRFNLSPPNNGDFISTAEFQIHLPFKFIDITKDFHTIITCVQCGFYSPAGYRVYSVTRERFPSQEIKDKIVASHEKCGVSRDELHWVDQNDCNYC